MSTSNGGGTANDAGVIVREAAAVTDEREGRPTPQEANAAYHNQLADDAEQAIKNTQQTIADLQESLKGRQAEAKQHREAAKRVRAEMKD